jgi:glycosyltransferase involved in cell wall biosynthesis
MFQLRKKDEVAVIIPAYNEDQQIAEVVTSAQKIITKSGFKCTVIVIDDGSKDATAQVARRAGAVVIRHILNSGAGSATATGLSYAEQNGFLMAATMDADGQHDPRDVAKGFELLRSNQADLLIGSRLIDSSGMSKVKVLGNRGLSFITYILFGINSTDSQSTLENEWLRILLRNALARQTEWLKD